MGGADSTGACLRSSIVPDPDIMPLKDIPPCVDQIEKLRLVVLKIASQSVGTDICDLNHARKPAINEERSFNE
jgi:hypothetical protein